MMATSGFVHSKIFDTRWGQALAFLDNDDNYETEVLTLRVWAPLCGDGSLAIVDIKIGLKGNVSDAACDVMESSNRSSLQNMNADKFEAALDKTGIAATLDNAFKEYPQ